jgi:hypothetical protein
LTPPEPPLPRVGQEARKNPIMASHIVLAPAPMSLQKIAQIYCTMVLPIR